MRFVMALGCAFVATACSSETSSTRSAGTTPTASNEPAPPGTDGGGGTQSSGGLPAGDGGTTEPKNNGFPTKWIDGTACASEPQIQTWKYGDGTFILRQSLCTNFEGPFVYLLVGKNKALLVDTGTGAVDLRSEVVKLLAGSGVELVVAHSHSHGDHVGGDAAFKNQPKTTVVGTSTAAVQQFFGVTTAAPSTFDLGDRTLDVLAIPGHQAAHLAFYDRSTKLLLTGDTLYPGRLYIDDWNSYKASVARLAAFVDAGHPVSHVLGGHIEMPKTGPDYAFGAKQHPNEHPLELGGDVLRDLRDVVQQMGTTPVRYVHPHFILSP